MTGDDSKVRSRRRRQTLDGYRAEYQDGDKSALVFAIHYCAMFRVPLPAWVRDAFGEGLYNVQTRRADWNDLLGDVRVKTPKQIARERLKVEQIGKLRRLLPSVTKPIERDSEGAFRELADRMGGGIKPRAVRELYYAHVTYDGKKHYLFKRRRRRSLRK